MKTPVKDERYFVAGGMYLVEPSGLYFRGVKEFDLVRPRGNEPCYITKSNKGLASTKHHASLYYVDKVDDGYMLYRVRHDMIDSPAKVFVKRNTDLYSYLQYSIQYAEVNDKFYS